MQPITLPLSPEWRQLLEAVRIEIKSGWARFSCCALDWHDPTCSAADQWQEFWAGGAGVTAWLRDSGGKAHGEGARKLRLSLFDALLYNDAAAVEWLRATLRDNLAGVKRR